jgi:hypothetical protein
MTIYLYVKTHNITGLKYLGKTTKKDPHKYLGSGIYWRNHLKKYGSDYATVIIKECHNKQDLKTWGIYYSNLWNVVDSSEWANLKPEDGDGGSIAGKTNGMYGKRHSVETRKKISQAEKGKIVSEETRRKMSITRKGKPGKKHTQETKEKISKIHSGKVTSDETKLKMSNNSKSKKPIQTPDGVFNSIRDAATYYKLTHDGISYRVKTCPSIYYFI